MNNKTFPIIPDGFFFIVPLAVLSIALICFKIVYVGIFFLVVTLFVMWFFRNPNRVTPEDEKAIISPADGRVIKIEEVEEKEMLNEKVRKVSIFMSILNVHVNRAPCSGTVKKISYRKGKFFPANLDKASALNERNSVLIETVDGRQILTIQIAGIIARRIVCWTKKVCRFKRVSVSGLSNSVRVLRFLCPLIPQSP